ncbi:alpha-(1,3)-fucosyltransferase C [Lingula anatina]|uniref:Fucosyltransferase n=1 Tax=Lingula anatina TaxID=7574 RepID=A0A1S3KBV1_LINAN|nr:alpha-(1,3)-fucosyltransferase C [Lingula anatina]XP_013419964.1 alpha-(1,3)-fucosyltransferase C [Lingula anatina]XP_013419965.1 alpha-(1,3)-fucosyltransferase C [Lingula anatina]XP_013419966.1 alpha-(1,3)-fucosyltransferase C [Lingula anatina]XP_013419967.1 alpha-(1,3)-fucosyltransferase C [Lingula anatina]XP_013419968.1 alpha-(1,3)-fucosyltransferase C [Lingula anatina]XP_013419970.1 alpha-(1,3)-fucosyltransferase C [Lingula anatina]XP_013419971.1 alpha-(1,3)-fucosyltransferase C [Ling|eukprot:XP_013419963.1 alpha-(1,3)-fucosyltransferase C [Lingula anatina]
MKTFVSFRVCFWILGTWVVVSVILIAWSLTEFTKYSTNSELQDQGRLQHGEVDETPDPNKNYKKIILLWGETFKKAMQLANLRNGDFLDNFKCKSTSCEFTTDKSVLENANAVIFDGNNLPESPPAKKKHHVWIFYSNEPPKRNARDNLKNWRNAFNLTMTYKRDSNIRFRLGNFTRRRQSLSKKYNSCGSKKRSVAWINDDCVTQSKREEYVKQLQKHIKVDIFGKCGDYLNCSLSHGRQQKNGQHIDFSNDDRERTQTCMQHIEQHYRFYLSFEEQLCQDYVAPELFETLQQDVIPVIRSGANLNALDAPYSFINTKDFKTPARLAKYLNFLDKNPRKCDQYFEWKNKYIATANRAMFSGAHWCELCAKLNQAHGRRTFHTTLENWWAHNTNCRDPDDLYVLI